MMKKIMKKLFLLFKFFINLFIIFFKVELHKKVYLYFNLIFNYI